MMRAWQQLKNLFHWGRALFWRARFGFPDKGIKLYGVTGTNGKTTTCYLIDSILSAEHGRKKTGMLTTVGIHIGKKDVLNETKMTTLRSYAAMKYLREMKDAGVTHTVLEVTSHALDQNRLAGLALEGAVITNIAREHLDYHGTMEEYAAAKMKILDYVKDGGVFVYKGDDEWIDAALRQIPNLKSKIPNKFQIPNLKITIASFTSYDAKSVVTPLPGEVNRENALAASLLMREAGVSEEAIRRGVEAVAHVPGRMEWIDEKSQITSTKSQTNHKPQITNNERGLPRVLIDYAVTPDALGRLYRDVKSQAAGKIYAVLGACGMRDRGKRPDMARAVAQYADELVLTREDPWMEDEEQIFSDLEKGLDQQCRINNGIAASRKEAFGFNATRNDCVCAWQRIEDRREAIRYCLEKARPEDVVVVTGKGAETGMAIGKRVLPWNDKEVILKEMQQIVNKSKK